VACLHSSKFHGIFIVPGKKKGSETFARALDPGVFNTLELELIDYDPARIAIGYFRVEGQSLWRSGRQLDGLIYQYGHEKKETAIIQLARKPVRTALSNVELSKHSQLLDLATSRLNSFS
jgi:hypothetical protein